DVVVFVKGLHEVLHGVGSCAELAEHAAALIEDDSETDRSILIPAEMREHLRLAILVDPEVLLLQAADVASVGVDHRCVNIHQPDVYTKSVLPGVHGGRSHRYPDEYAGQNDVPSGHTLHL